MSGNDGTGDMFYQGSIEASIASAPDAANAGIYRGNRNFGSAYGDFSQSVERYNASSQGSSGGTYTVRNGDTLQAIAASLYGDGNLWYRIAEANGLSAQSQLTEGQTLLLPAGVTKSTHNASTFQPYDAIEAMGDTLPTTPKPPKKPKCAALGAIIMIAIAVAISAWLGPQFIAAAQGLLAGGGTVIAGSAAAIGGAALGGAAVGVVGSVASQAFGMAAGFQSKFDWKGVAMAGISGAVGGLMGAGAITKNGILSSVSAAKGISQVALDFARGAVSNAVTQGIGVATGLQKKFDWAGVAVGGVASAVSGAINRTLAHNGIGGVAGSADAADFSAGNVANFAVSGVAGAIAGAATRSVLKGTNFGDNLLAALPDVIGSTIGNALGGAIRGSGSSTPEKPVEDYVSTAPELAPPEGFEVPPGMTMTEYLKSLGNSSLAIAEHQQSIFDELNNPGGSLVTVSESLQALGMRGPANLAGRGITLPGTSAGGPIMIGFDGGGTTATNSFNLGSSTFLTITGIPKPNQSINNSDGLISMISDATTDYIVNPVLNSVVRPIMSNVVDPIVSRIPSLQTITDTVDYYDPLKWTARQIGGDNWAEGYQGFVKDGPRNLVKHSVEFLEAGRDWGKDTLYSLITDPKDTFGRGLDWAKKDLPDLPGKLLAATKAEVRKTYGQITSGDPAQTRQGAAKLSELILSVAGPGMAAKGRNLADNLMVDLSNAGDLAPGFYRAHPSQLRFTQSTASPNFSKGGTINDLVSDLRNGLSPDKVGGGPLQVVMRDGVPFSLDNRRLVAFNAAGVKNIPIEIVSLRDPSVALRFADRFDPIAGEGRQIIIVPNKGIPGIPNSGRTPAQQLLYDLGLIRRAP